MKVNKPEPEDTSPEKIIAEARRSQALREKEYRGQALRMYPHICARCGREFAGRKLRELTVHHKDHNHENNPPDGGNWELLCLYCHDNEHQEYLDRESFGTAAPEPGKSSPLQKPFAGLQELIREKKKKV